MDILRRPHGMQEASLKSFLGFSSVSALIGLSRGTSYSATQLNGLMGARMRRNKIRHFDSWGIQTPGHVQNTQASWSLFITDLPKFNAFLQASTIFNPPCVLVPIHIAAEASNAYLDGLSLWRTASNQPFCSVQWGPVAEVGMASKERKHGRSVQGF